MSPKEIVRRSIKFEIPERLAKSFPEPYGSDFAWIGMDPSPDRRPPNGRDEWGALWENIGICKMGEVKEFPLKDWADFDKLLIPAVNAPHRWQGIEEARKKSEDKFVMASGLSIYERAHFIRGLENTWTDIYEYPQELEDLLDILVEMNIQAIKHYKDFQPDGYMFWDDWGLQDKLMISPEKWRELWKPRYARIYTAAHEAGMLTFLHSCGHIVEILDDLIEAGLDVIQMDQQENMGLDLLSKRFAGRIAFWCPVDIQNTMCRGSLDEIRRYCHLLCEKLGGPRGGFIAGYYGDPTGAGHSKEAIDTMCQEFLKISGSSK
ncbi:MAG: hypothetical protein A2X49_17375 [Lentisphaerae bacterium GWF2_52_8]|nr:MAG: hypothetical protein A2X49_17375 [Lentisphaerae bacterium GWF2_52_8]